MMRTHLIPCAVILSLLFTHAEARAGSLPRRDGSLPVQAYVDMGMPSPDQAWGETEYKKALAVIAKIASDDGTKLPRTGSLKSGALFARMISTENLNTLTDKKIPVRDRLSKVIRLAEPMRIAQYYVDARAANYEREIIALCGFEMSRRIAAVEVTTEAATAPSTPAKTRSQLQAQVQGTRQAVVDHVAFLIDALGNPIESATRHLDVDCIREHLHEILKVLEPAERSAAAAKISAVASKENDEKLKEKLLALATELEGKK